MRKKVLLLLGIVVLSMFLFIRPMKAEIDVVELSPVADIFTEERGFGIQIRDSNYLMTYYWIGGDELRETYIRFNLPTIDELYSIKLKLTEVGNVNNNITDFPIRITMVSNNWTEQDTTWDSKLEEFGTSTIVYLTKDTSDEYYRDYIFDLSSFVDTIKGINDTLISFYLSPNDLTVDFAYLDAKSSEYSNITCRPKLIIEYGVPEPPTPFTLTSNAGNPDRDGQFILQWTDSERADYYSVYQNDTLIESGVTSHFFLMKISNGSYLFKVVAFNEFGNVSSNEININVEIQDIPPSSFLLTSNAGNPDVDGYFILQWTDSDYADEYSLYRNGTVVIYNGVNRNYYAENYSSGSYTFKVVSFNDYGNTSSNELTITVEIPPEPNPYPGADYFYADLDQYYAAYVPYNADQYDFFNMSVWSGNIVTGYIMDESNYNQFVSEGFIQPSSNIDYAIFGVANKWHTFIPTHADAWYFVFINVFAEHTHLDSYIYFHEDYFTELEPEPPLPPPPPNLSFLIYIIIGEAAIIFGLIYLKVIRPKMTPKREIKKEEQVEQISLKPNYLKRQGVEAEKLREQHLENQKLEREKRARLNKQQPNNAMIYKGTKNEIWQTYIRMKRNNDKRLSEFLSYENNRNVIAKKNFDVFQAKSSNIYHRSSCGYLSRSRTLKRMSRSDAIISGGVKCNSCMKEFDSSTCIIAFIIVAIITIFGLLTGGIYF